MLRIPHFLDYRLTDGGKVVSCTRRPRAAPQKYYFPASVPTSQETLLHYKDQQVKTVQVTRCLLWDQYETQGTLRGPNTGFYNFKEYSYVFPVANILCVSSTM
jgi:hypothetical protein